MSKATIDISKGLALLDDKIPFWWREDHEPAIDLERLDITSGSCCIGGQLADVNPDRPFEPPYNSFVKQLGLTLHQECSAGFLWGVGVHPRDLTTAWRDVIARRRAEAVTP